MIVSSACKAEEGNKRRPLWHEIANGYTASAALTESGAGGPAGGKRDETTRRLPRYRHRWRHCFCLHNSFHCEPAAGGGGVDHGAATIDVHSGVAAAAAANEDTSLPFVRQRQRKSDSLRRGTRGDAT